MQDRQPAAGAQGVVVLGATGSIGASTLDVLSRHPDRYYPLALTANRHIDAMLELCIRHRPLLAVMADAAAADALRESLRDRAIDIEVDAGEAGLIRAAQLEEAAVVMAAITGAAGLKPTLASVRAGKRVLLANKEALVMAGPLFMQQVAAHNAQLLPIDSEHNAIFQCLPQREAGAHLAGVERIVLTASGGPFLGWDKDRLASVTPAQAVAHPKWQMGAKISVDSATLMNKGLEVIEACWLFDIPVQQVDVLVHPQSIVHSLVHYRDGSVLAQMGNPDMRTPIAHALGWPERLASGTTPLNLAEIATLEFQPPDEKNFPCLALARQAMAAGGTATALLNGANEVAVAAFLDGQIGFNAIAELVDDTLQCLPVEAALDLDCVQRADQQARLHVNRQLQGAQSPLVEAP